MLLMLLPCVNVTAWATINLEQEYIKLDKAIEQTDRYVENREKRINTYRTALGGWPNG